MDNTTRRKIERVEAELDSLLTHFPDLANPIAVGWLAMRLEGWRREARSSQPTRTAQGSGRGSGGPRGS
ncbi:MAG: hypothetical protein JRI25_02650 [Deltaproteobacteria bacterium]|nr:hypothetical protein [Deltaproteobacteria bacterium]